MLHTITVRYVDYITSHHITSHYTSFHLIWQGWKHHHSPLRPQIMDPLLVQITNSGIGDVVNPLLKWDSLQRNCKEIILPRIIESWLPTQSWPSLLPRGIKYSVWRSWIQLSGTCPPLLSTIRYDYQPESPTTQTKGTNILNLMRSKEIFFLKKKDASCFHLSFRRKWANVKVHSSMESFWAILGISNQPPSPHPHEISIPSLS